MGSRLHGRGAGDNVWRRPAAAGVYGLLQGAAVGTKLLGDGMSKRGLVHGDG